MGGVIKGKGEIGALIRRPLALPITDFSEPQMHVINHHGSPLVVLGGPGSGKTTLIVESALARIQGGQDPNSILMLTFGRERASELRDSVALRTSAIMHEPIARTFHSLAFSILKMKASEYASDPILMSGPEQEFFIRDLLDGDTDLGKNYWPADLEKALTTHGFVRELRDLILRASERNLTPASLAELGREHGEKYWQSAAVFWKQYLDVMDLQADSAGDAKRRIDPSQIVIEAYHHLKANPSIANDLRTRFTTILVDEFQESDPAQRILLRELADHDIFICADADSAIGRFRGADPDQLDEELEYYRNRGSQIVLHENYRSVPTVFDIGKLVTSEFRGSAPQRDRTCSVAPGDKDQESVVVGRFRSLSEEAQFIAYQFRYAHLIENIPWSEMAVVLRTPGPQASALRRAFSQSGIPVASDIQALSNNAAIAPFLLLAQIALEQRQLTTDNCERLLMSEFGGADSVSLRRMQRALIASRGQEDQRSGAELLIAAIEKGEIPIDGAQPLWHVHELLSRARRILRRSSTQAEDLLWEIWSNSLTSDGGSLPESWRRQALRGGTRGAGADRDLDAMMQLFEAARRFAERFPHSKADSFIRQISQENILGDVITAQGQRPDVVEILTAHAAKGREWEIVAIAGLQDGVWPNLRQRGSLLGSERLVDRLRHPGLARKELEVVSASGLVEDERRLLHVAVTRAKSRLIVSAVQKDDDEPSAYFEEISTAVLGDQNAGPTMTRAPRPITPAALVATLRAELGSGNSTAASSLLKRLDIEGLPAAHIDSWAGVQLLSNSTPIVPPDAPVSVSPSSAEAFTDCGVKWFLERHGGTDGDSTAQVLGSAIHAFAALIEDEPSLTEADLIFKLRESWKLIDPNTGWVSNAQLRRAVTMIEKFIKYHNASIEEREIIGVEANFKIRVGRALISGSVDRLEVTKDGKLFIVDFKTGKKEITHDEKLTNLQMQAYQLAVIEGGFSDRHASRQSAGAELVYLGTDKADASIRRQPAIDPAEVGRTMMEIADGMGENHFVATFDRQLCARCGVRNACPIQSEGRAVME